MPADSFCLSVKTETRSANRVSLKFHLGPFGKARLSTTFHEILQIETRGLNLQFLEAPRSGAEAAPLVSLADRHGRGSSKNGRHLAEIGNRSAREGTRYGKDGFSEIARRVCYLMGLPEHRREWIEIDERLKDFQSAFSSPENAKTSLHLKIHLNQSSDLGFLDGTGRQRSQVRPDDQ